MGNSLTEGVLDRARSVGLPDDYNPQQFDPALLTFREYYRIANASDKFHPSDAYDTTVEKLNKWGHTDKTEFPILIRQFRVHGLQLELRAQARKVQRVKIDPTTLQHERVDGELQFYTDEEVRKLGWPLHEWALAIYDQNICVGLVTDEWNCVLVQVPQEYRGFGLGKLLVKYARSIDPKKTSGGFTQSGFRNFQRVYQEFVLEALSSGFYSKMVRQGTLTVTRVKEIIASARALGGKLTPEEKLDLTDNPKDYLLFIDEYGDFILYDRKLIDVLKQGDRGYYFQQRMLKGMVYVSLQGQQGEYGMLRQFGGDTPAIKRFLMSCAIEYCRRADVPLYVERDEPESVDPAMGTIAQKPSNRPGFWSYRITPTGKRADYDRLGHLEAAWRKQFDRYDEFKNSLLEMAYAKFRPE